VFTKSFIYLVRCRRQDKIINLNSLRGKFHIHEHEMTLSIIIAGALDTNQQTVHISFSVLSALAMGISPSTPDVSKSTSNGHIT
jgi:hypothetical protein